jgi:hypothetical protein
MSLPVEFLKLQEFLEREFTEVWFALLRLDRPTIRPARLIERRYRRPAADVARLRTAIDWFGTREAGSLTPGEIEAKLNAVAAEQKWAASTINHYRSVMSLAYRIAKRDGKVETNPVRDVPHQQENNNRVRSLTTDEERRLRTVIRNSYPTHEDERFPGAQGVGDDKAVRSYRNGPLSRWRRKRTGTKTGTHALDGFASVEQSL